ncbi:MAG: SRPBCC domain-containing protein [Leptospira sp.]|nr:SRPBCC domain-containing protein [Leptospira sp.]
MIQKIKFPVSRDAVYNALIDSKKHSAFTGSSANISKTVGGKFSAYDGYCYGENLELIPGKLIVQTWRADNWEAGHFSEIRFEFKKVKDGTELKFVQTGIPIEEYEGIKKGWSEFYWEPMNFFFNK